MIFLSIFSAGVLAQTAPQTQSTQADFCLFCKAQTYSDTNDFKSFLQELTQIRGLKDTDSNGNESHYRDPFYVSVGKSAREGSASVDVGYFVNKYSGIELAFDDEGHQPDGITNINRVFSLDAFVKVPLTQMLSAFVEGGVSASHQEGGGYSDPTGRNVGAGVSYLLTKNLSAELKVKMLQYKQFNVPANETFVNGTGGLSYHF
jgi:opacity protein-like surface antigen